MTPVSPIDGPPPTPHDYEQAAARVRATITGQTPESANDFGYWKQEVAERDALLDALTAIADGKSETLRFIPPDVDELDEDERATARVMVPDPSMQHRWIEVTYRTGSPTAHLIAIVTAHADEGEGDDGN